MLSKDSQNILSLISDSDLEKELSINVRERILEQKLFYVSKKMSERYYERVVATDILAHDYWKFLKKNISKKEKLAFVSLGCGDSRAEKYALKQLEKEGYDVVYIGVDVSKHMLEMAAKNLQKIHLKKEFVQADMASEHFRETIFNLTENCQKRVYAFIGGTFGNVNQTNMADIIYNILKKNDLLWLDVMVRPSLKKEDDIKLFKRYLSRLSDSKEVSFYFGPLANMGVSIGSGKMGLKIGGERSVGSLLFIYYFKIQKKTIVNFMKDKLHLLPDEEIELFSIRAYHPKTLIDFFREHEFKLLNTKQENNEGQFMFSKKQ